MTTELVTFETAKAWADENIAEALSYVTIAHDFTIETQKDAELAATQLSAITAFVKKNESKRMEITNPYRDVSAKIKAEFDEANTVANKATSALRKLLTDWTNEQARLAEVARLAEERRLADERRLAQETADKEAARLATLRTPEAQVKAADRLETAQARVEELATTAVVVPKVAAVKGFSLRNNWQPEYGDIMELIKAAAVNPKLARFLDWNTVSINKQVKASEADTEIPGVRAVNNQTSAVR